MRLIRVSIPAVVGEISKHVPGDKIVYTHVMELLGVGKFMGNLALIRSRMKAASSMARSTKSP